ncbi:hypothetical protein HZF07_22030 [Nocardioides sp. CGMCC 1.13656]|uniref:hypothetical protein n=1 Tax=Nocardioides TaxID=1839 RepID=UPI0015EB3309|nr:MULTISPECIES: hypothetical protein [unclassified Nocardioides]MBA2956413.1 hypothetical protein [Nocardioides sp. CGMCC 1.13656]
MVHNFARSLRAVTPFDRATPEHFYDATIEHAWPLALALYDGDGRAAADAVVAAYGSAWHAGTRDRTSLLVMLVQGARHRRRSGAVVLPFTSRGRSAPPPLPA